MKSNHWWPRQHFPPAVVGALLDFNEQLVTKPSVCETRPLMLIIRPRSFAVGAVGEGTAGRTGRVTCRNHGTRSRILQDSLPLSCLQVCVISY